MRWISENKGSAAALVVLAIAMAAMAVFLLQGVGSEAEAVLGDQGNLGTAGPNHPHNLSAGSNYARAVSEDEICIFCHTPHGAMVREQSGKPIINAPLWNHVLSDVTYYNVKSPYGTPAYNASLSNSIALLSTPPNTPDGASRLCLSCHDGTVSIGAVYQNYPSLSDINMVDACMGTGGAETAGLVVDSFGNMGKLTSACRAFIGTDLRSKHVVSIPMTAALIANADAKCISGPPFATMTLRFPWFGGGADTVLLRPTAELDPWGNPGETRSTGKYRVGYNYGVQCSTCHDPHKWAQDDGDGIREQDERMLVLDFNSLCLVCHVNC